LVTTALNCGIKYLGNPIMAFPSSSRSDSNRGSANEVQDNAAALRTDIANLAESVKRLATEQVQDKAKETLGDVEAAIRRNPTQGALIAAGVGFVVGLIITR
jgi:ElaB/YqjD/DUF883 family membrane-anchored ribosome-binding protein